MAVRPTFNAVIQPNFQPTELHKIIPMWDICICDMCTINGKRSTIEKILILGIQKSPKPLNDAPGHRNKIFWYHCFCTVRSSFIMKCVTDIWFIMLMISPLLTDLSIS